MPTATTLSGWISADHWKTFEQERVNAHRIFSSGSVCIERFAQDVLISRVSQVSLDALMQELDDWSKAVGFTPRRIYRRDMMKSSDVQTNAVLVHGDAQLPSAVTIEEYGLKYEVDFASGYSVGFFMDQRHNRRHLRALAAKDVLNCFAYTCSFSVVAAAAGGKTTSIDLARKALDRGKRNFELNGLSVDEHAFHMGDVREWFRRFSKKKVTFDAIVLDPPTFSRNKEGDVFQVEKDMSELIAWSIQCVAPKGQVLLSTNCSTLHSRDLVDLAKLELRKVGKTASFQSEPIPDDIPEESAPSTVWMKMG